MKFAQVPFTDQVLRKVMGENALRFLNVDNTGRRL
jgi:predicted TIM-barrel fold metal-dependent hydrolase